MANFNVKPTPLKVILPSVLVIVLICMTFYGKSLMMNYPACEIRDSYKLFLDAKLLNNTSLMNKSMNIIKSYTGQTSEISDKMNILSQVYFYVDSVNPLISINKMDISSKFMNQNQVNCMNDFINLAMANNKTPSSLFEIKTLQYNPLYSFKNLVINSLVLFIEAYLIICVIELLINLAKRK